MKDQVVAPLLPEEPPGTSEIENHDAVQYDKEEELLLLQIGDVSNGPPSPSLEAVMDRSNESSWKTSESQLKPLLMERPQSSGIDMAAFSFAKPSQYGKSFSLQSSARQSSAVPVSHRSKPTRKGEVSKESDRRRKASPIENPLLFNAESENHPTSRTEGEQPVLARPTSSLPQDAPDHREPTQDPENASSDFTLYDDASKARDAHTDTESFLPAAKAQFKKGLELGNENFADSGDETHGQRLKPQGNGEKRQREIEPSRYSITADNVINEDFASEMRPCSPINDETRAPKRRRANSKRLPCSKQTAQIAVGNEKSQLSEDDLFQMLIGRIRQREENETAAANLRQRMETDIFELVEENKALKGQLELLFAHLQKRTSDCRTYKAQIETWKSKLGRFKRFLNSLGTDYQALRGEAIQLKAQRSSLNEEKKAIRCNIDEVKEQISQIAGVIGDKRSHLRESANIVSTLEQALRNSEDKTQVIQTQLEDEKRKTSVLESYIKNLSRTQTKQLGLIRDEQLGMIKKIECVSNSMDKQLNSSQTNLQSVLDPAIKEVLSSVQDMNEKFSGNQTDTRQFSEKLQGFMVHIDSATLQLTKEVERGSEANGNFANDLKTHFQSIESALGNDSVLFKQLATNDELCRNLYEMFNSVAPNIFNLSTSLTSFENKETGLSHQIEDLEKIIRETRKAAEKAPPEAEAFDHMAENTRLKLQIEELSSKLDIKEESLRNKESEIEGIRDSYDQAKAKIQEAESQARQIECEKAALQDKLKSIEGDIREELSRASVISRDQTRAKFDQELHRLMKDKADVEKSIQATREQLTKAQQGLVEREASLKKQEIDYDCLISEKEKAIQSLQRSNREYTEGLSVKDAEIKKHQESEASSLLRQESLQQKLNEAHETVISLNDQLSSMDNKIDLEAFQKLQNKIELLQEELSRKKEECLSAQQDLDAVNSLNSSLESGKKKAKAEIHALLRRVQDSEQWMKGIKETFGKLGIHKPEEPFSETWNRLESLLQPNSTKVLTASIPPSSQDQDIAVSYDRQSPKSINIASKPSKTAANSSQNVLHMAELMHQSRNIQECSFTPPKAFKNPRSPNSGDTIPNTFPSSQLPNSIVPFSSIQQQLSPRRCSSPSQGPDGFPNLLIMTPGGKESPKETEVTSEDNKKDSSSGNALSQAEDALKSVPANGHAEHDKNTQLCENHQSNEDNTRPRTDKATNEPIGGHEHPSNVGRKQKAVKFESQSITTTDNGDKGKVPVPIHSEMQKPVADDPGNERKQGRLNRRTYSRTRQTGFMREPQRTLLDDTPPAINDNERFEHESQSKRLKTSAASDTRVSGQPQGISGLFGRKSSPTSLAAGSSRQSPANATSFKPRPMARNQRRVGRITRGERYSSRFSQEQVTSR